MNTSVRQEDNVTITVMFPLDQTKASQPDGNSLSVGFGV